MATLATWLAHHIEAVRQCAPDPHPDRHHQGAAQLADEIRYAVDHVRRVIDQPARLFYAGPCQQCHADLYCGADDHGRPTASFITCRQCSHHHETAERLPWLLRATEDRLATPVEISQAIPTLYGRDIRAGTIRQWVHRGQLAPRAWLHHGVVYRQRQHDHDRPLCRIGDVIDLARQQDAS